MEQRTLEWHRERLGKITGSQVGELMNKGKLKDSEFSQKGLSYLENIAFQQRIDRRIIEDDFMFSEYLDETGVSSKAMKYGTQREPDARELYSLLTHNNVEEVGCIIHNSIKGFGSSPDGIICQGEGVIEIKCPTPQTYFHYLLTIKSPEDLKKEVPGYYWQCMAHMAVTGARWCDFIIYGPYDEKEKMRIISILRNEEEIALLENKVKKGLNYINKLLKIA